MDEQHQEKFRGWWIPAEILVYWRRGTITRTEVDLLAQIDAFTDVMTGEGCTASNDYLAQRFGLTSKYVSDCVSKLVRLGLLRRRIRRSSNGSAIRELWRMVIDPNPDKSGLATDPNPDLSGHPYLHPPSEGVGTKSNTEEGAVGFFEEFDVKTPNDSHHSQAERLLKCLRTNGRLAGPASVKKWAVHFRRLSGDLEGDTQRIEDVLTWYLTHIRDRYTPRVYSAASFRDKFIAIEDAMRRASPTTKVKPGELANRIADRLRGRGWPKGSVDDLPVVAQLSLDAYQRFCDDRRKLDLTTLPKLLRQRLQSLMGHLDNRLPSPAHFVEQWLIDVFDQIDGWNGWSGNLLKMAFTREAKRFRRMGRGWANDYCREPGRWDSLMELMNES